MKEGIIFISGKGSFFSGILVDVSFSNNLSSGVEKCLVRCPTFQECSFTCAPDRALKKWVVKTKMYVWSKDN